MAAEGHATDSRVSTTQTFVALPEPTDDRREAFTRCLSNVVRILRLDVPPESEGRGRRSWEQRARSALREACREGIELPNTAFDALIAAAVHDPDPSFNRQFLEPALNAFGRRRVQSALLGCLRAGPDVERAGAARAWYWSALPPRMPLVRAENPAGCRVTEADDESDVVTDWNKAALREFVDNEHLDVRRCILPGLPLRKSAYPPELHDLVSAAVATARSHPDEYIRHRVEHQVGD